MPRKWHAQIKHRTHTFARFNGSCHLLSLCQTIPLSLQRLLRTRILPPFQQNLQTHVTYRFCSLEQPEQQFGLVVRKVCSSVEIFCVPGLLLMPIMSLRYSPSIKYISSASFLYRRVHICCCCSFVTCLAVDGWRIFALGFRS